MGDKGITIEEWNRLMEEAKREDEARMRQQTQNLQSLVDEAKGKHASDEREAEEKINQYMKNHSETGIYEYLVRGATLICSNGTHKRKLNLPKCHGVYIGEHPVMHELECVSEAVCGRDKCNIAFFGICIPETGSPPPTEVKTYSMTEKNSKAGIAAVVTGHKCKPCIIGQWRDTYDATKIVDNGDKAGRSAGLNTLTTGSFLVCRYGGLILPINSGQQFAVKMEDFYNAADYYKVVRKPAGDGRTPG
jgi:hypothetical protein